MSTGTALSIALGVGLAAACGFRVFVPLLVAAVAARTGHLHLAPGFGWLASDGAPRPVGGAACAPGGRRLPGRTPEPR